MSGAINVRQGVVWMPAGWVLDYALEQIAEELAPIDVALSRDILSGRTDDGGYTDMSAWGAMQFRALTGAAKRRYDRILQSGPTSFHDPSFYDGFIRQFSDLVTMLQHDPRMAE